MRVLLSAALLIASTSCYAFTPPVIDREANPFDAHLDPDGSLVVGGSGSISQPEVYPDSKGGLYDHLVHYTQYIVVAKDGSMRWYLKTWDTYASITRPPPPNAINENEPVTWREGNSIMDFASWSEAVHESHGFGPTTRFLIECVAGAHVQAFLAELSQRDCAFASIQRYGTISLFDTMMWRVEAKKRLVDIWLLDPNFSGLKWWENRAVLQNNDWNNNGVSNSNEIRNGLDPLAGGYVKSLLVDDDGTTFMPPDQFAWPACVHATADAGPDQRLESGANGKTMATLNGSASTGEPPLTYAWTFFPAIANGVTGANPTLEFSLGTTLATLTVTDADGNIATDTVVIVVEDTIKPVLSDVPAEFSVEQANLDGTRVNLVAPTAWDLSDGNPVVTHDQPAVFPLGTTTVTWSASDRGGNTVTATTKVTVVDTTPPQFVTVPGSAPVEQDTLDGATVALAAPLVRDICDAAPAVSSDAPNIFPLGDTTVTFTATDASGNVSRATTVVRVRDTQAPALSNIPADVTVEQAALDGTAVTLGNPAASDVCDAAPLVSSNAPAVFPLGATVVTFTATDASGNQVSATMNVTVIDTTPPVLSNVQTSVRAEAAGRNGTPVTLALPAATDICDAAPVVTSNAPARFPLGLTMVTFTAIDASGNVARATTNVMVSDTTPPVFSNVPAPISVQSKNGKPVKVSVPMPTATDLVDPNPLVTSNAPGTYPVGVTTVTFTAKDSNGNTSTATTTVTVTDNKKKTLAEILIDLVLEILRRLGLIP
jgi:hypothetical protein